MIRQIRFAPRILFFGSLVLLFASCVGIRSEIDIRADGSGTIVLEYRISRLVEGMGKLDGNENLLPLPVGRTDLERTVGRVPGLTLSSFSSTQDEKDITVKASFAFTSLESLRVFLDATGRAAALSAADGNRVLVLRFSEGGGPLDPDLRQLVDSVFSGYELDLSIQVPSAPQAGFTDAAGKASTATVGTATVDRRVARYQVPIADLLNAKDPVIFSLSWKE